MAVPKKRPLVQNCEMFRDFVEDLLSSDFALPVSMRGGRPGFATWIHDQTQNKLSMNENSQGSS